MYQYYNRTNIIFKNIEHLMILLMIALQKKHCCNINKRYLKIVLLHAIATYRWTPSCEQSNRVGQIVPVGTSTQKYYFTSSCFLFFLINKVCTKFAVSVQFRGTVRPLICSIREVYTVVVLIYFNALPLCLTRGGGMVGLTPIYIKC